MSAFLAGHGGLVVTVLLVLGVINVVLSAAQQILVKLAVAEPSWLTSVSNVLLKIVQYLSANTPSPTATPTTVAATTAAPIPTPTPPVS